jgi:nucleoside-diphosphate-sugar epimerase
MRRRHCGRTRGPRTRRPRPKPSKPCGRRRARASRPSPCARGSSGVTDTTHVDNVVEGLVLAAEKGRSGEAYFVTDGEPVVFREFVTALLRTQGVEPPERSLPAWTAAPLARACEAAWKALPLPGEPPMTSFRSWLLTQECTIDISKARDELGYTPIVSHQQGLAELRG